MSANPRNLSQVLGTTRSWQVTATYQGNPILGKYVAGDNLTASIWQGQDQTVLLTPSVTWIVPSLATINLTITAAQLAIAGLAPGVYHLQVDVTPLSDSQPRCVYYGLIQFDPTAGSTPAFPSWVSYNDVVGWNNSILSLQDQDDDLTGFARQRNIAMMLSVAWILRRYSPVPGQSRRYLDSTRTVAGPYLCFSDTGPNGEDAPTRAELEGWLNTPSRVILTEDLVEANVLFTAANIYGGVPGTSNPYSQAAKTCHEGAITALERAYIDIDAGVVPSGSATIRVDRNVIWLT